MTYLIKITDSSRGLTTIAELLVVLFKRERTAVFADFIRFKSDINKTPDRVGSSAVIDFARL